MIIRIVTNDGEWFNVALNSRAILSNKCRPNWDTESKRVWSACRLRGACKYDGVKSVNGHAPEVRELMDLIDFAESIIFKWGE